MAIINSTFSITQDTTQDGNAFFATILIAVTNTSQQPSTGGTLTLPSANFTPSNVFASGFTAPTFSVSGGDVVIDLSPMTIGAGQTATITIQANETANSATFDNAGTTLELLGDDVFATTDTVIVGGVGDLDNILSSLADITTTRYNYRNFHDLGNRKLLITGNSDVTLKPQETFIRTLAQKQALEIELGGSLVVDNRRIDQNGNTFVQHDLWFESERTSGWSNAVNRNEALTVRGNLEVYGGFAIFGGSLYVDFSATGGLYDAHIKMANIENAQGGQFYYNSNSFECTGDTWIINRHLSSRNVSLQSVNATQLQMRLTNLRLSTGGAFPKTEVQEIFNYEASADQFQHYLNDRIVTDFINPVMGTVYVAYNPVNQTNRRYGCHRLYREVEPKAVDIDGNPIDAKVTLQEDFSDPLNKNFSQLTNGHVLGSVVDFESMKSYNWDIVNGTAPSQRVLMAQVAQQTNTQEPEGTGENQWVKRYDVISHPVDGLEDVEATLYFASYVYNITPVKFRLRDGNNAEPIANMLPDTSISETDTAIVNTYTTNLTSQQAYDYLKLLRVNTNENNIDIYASISGDELITNHNVVIDPAKTDAPTFDGTTITFGGIFDGNISAPIPIVGFEHVTGLVNGAKYVKDGDVIDQNYDMVVYNDSTNGSIILDGVDFTGSVETILGGNVEILGINNAKAIDLTPIETNGSITLEDNLIPNSNWLIQAGATVINTGTDPNQDGKKGFREVDFTTIQGFTTYTQSSRLDVRSGANLTIDVTKEKDIFLPTAQNNQYIIRGTLNVDGLITQNGVTIPSTSTFFESNQTPNNSFQANFAMIRAINGSTFNWLGGTAKGLGSIFFDAGSTVVLDGANIETPAQIRCFTTGLTINSVRSNASFLFFEQPNGIVDNVNIYQSNFAMISYGKDVTYQNYVGEGNLADISVIDNGSFTCYDFKDGGETKVGLFFGFAQGGSTRHQGHGSFVKTFDVTVLDVNGNTIDSPKLFIPDTDNGNRFNDAFGDRTASNSLDLVGDNSGYISDQEMPTVYFSKTNNDYQHPLVDPQYFDYRDVNNNGSDEFDFYFRHYNYDLEVSRIKLRGTNKQSITLNNGAIDKNIVELDPNVSATYVDNWTPTRMYEYLKYRRSLLPLENVDLFGVIDGDELISESNITFDGTKTDSPTYDDLTDTWTFGGNYTGNLTINGGVVTLTNGSSLDGIITDDNGTTGLLNFV